VAGIPDTLKGRSFTRVADWSPVELGTALDLADELKVERARRRELRILPGRTVGLIFRKPSTRTRISSEVGIAELGGAPCSTLANSLTVQFTAAHSNLGGVGVTLEGPGGPYAFTLNPDPASVPAENLFGTADADGWTFASLPPCAYLLKLSVGVLLTTGDGSPSPLVDYIAFCKGRGRG